MAIIANMEKREDGSFEGKFKTVMLNCRLRVEPIEDKGSSDKHPDYRVKIGGYEAGAGWNKVSKNGNSFISLQIDDPLFPNPIYANLIEGNEGYILLWNRD